MAYVNVHALRRLKEELGWAIEQWFRLIINKMLLIYNSYTTKNIKNKTILIYVKQYVCIAMLKFYSILRHKTSGYLQEAKF